MFHRRQLRNTHEVHESEAVCGMSGGETGDEDDMNPAGVCRFDSTKRSNTYGSEFNAATLRIRAYSMRSLLGYS